MDFFGAIKKYAPWATGHEIFRLGADEVLCFFLKYFVLVYIV